MLVPFFFHWYDGDEPPLVGVAVKVTEVPAQILVVLGDIDTDGTTTEQAVIWALSILTYAELLLRVTAVPTSGVTSGDTSAVTTTTSTVKPVSPDKLRDCAGFNSGGKLVKGEETKEFTIFNNDKGIPVCKKPK